MCIRDRSLDNFELNNFLQNEYIENPLLDYNENSNLPSWNQYVSYSSAKEDEDIYKEIPDFSENGIKEFLLDQLNQRNFSDLQWTAMQDVYKRQIIQFIKPIYMIHWGKLFNSQCFYHLFSDPNNFI